MADKPTSEEFEPKVGNTFICFLVFLILTICVSITFAQENKYILVLHSYHKGQKWNDSITQGVESILNSNGQNIELFFEYMDTKRFYDDRHLNNLYQLLSHKFHNHKFDAIICTDDHAYNFILERSHELFPKTPIVFCGVNNFNEALLAGRNWITGVVESTDLAKTIKIALQLHPKIKNVFVLVDKTVSGMAHRKQLEEIISQLNKTLTFDIPDDIELPLLKKKLHKLSKDSIVLWMNFFSDKFGNPISLKDVSDLLQKYCNVPVYSLWDTRLGKGAVGGMLTSGHAQGEVAAKVALRIINGEKVENIPVIKESPNRYMFDYKQLKRFNIKSSLIPNGSIIINKPSSFYSEHTGLVWLCLIIIVGLSMIILSLVLNITKRKKAEETLRESEERYRLLADNVTDVIWIRDINLRLTYVSPSITNQTGYTVEETMARTLEEALTPDSLKLVLEVFTEELEIENLEQKDLFRSRTIELEIKCKDGSTIWAELKMSFLRDQLGNPTGIIGVTRNITDRKHLEDQLQQAYKMESIGTLAGGIAHDFNNILSSVFGFTELALDDAKKGTLQHEHLQEVLIAGNRAKDLVKQILTFSRQVDQEQKPIQVKPIVKETLKLLRASIPTTIDIKDNAQANSLVIGDTTQIHQVLMNLCTNAAHAMEDDGGLLTVSLSDVELDSDFVSNHPNLKPGPYINLTVTDTGHGISSDVMEKMFDPFFTTKETGEGTGMGLSVVHGIVRSHGGDIYVYSELGKGSTFKVYLPAIERRLKPEERVEKPIPTGTERILFIDDEPAIVNVGKRLLKSLGYDVTTRTSSIEALELFKAQKGRFDLVITDMTMPQMTGDNLSKELMSIRPNIPVILCTGFSARIDDKKAMNMSIRAFVSKPILKREIAEAIRRVLNEK